MYQPFLVFGVHPKSVSKITALGMATAHCNHVGQSSIFVTPLFPPSGSHMPAIVLPNLPHSRAYP
jgi:hypothetical protein